MQPIQSYAESDGVIRLLLQGDPKVGKTTLACQFPGAYIIDVDVNLGGPLRYLRDNGLTLPVGYDVLDQDDEGKPVPLPNRYQRFVKLMNEAQTNPLVQTIVIDSATSFVEVLTAEVLRAQNKIVNVNAPLPPMDKQLWGFFFRTGYEFMGLIKKLRKHIVFICHEKLEKNPDGSVVMPYRISWPGQLGTILPSFFTDVWRCETVQKPGINPTYEWVVRTMPDYQFKLGNSLNLPATFKFDWKIIEAKLKGQTSCPK